jgi:hypothetical protein
MSRRERELLHAVLGSTFSIAGSTLLLLLCGGSTASLIGSLIIGLLCGITAHHADSSIR